VNFFYINPTGEISLALQVLNSLFAAVNGGLHINKSVWCSLKKNRVAFKSTNKISYYEKKRVSPGGESRYAFLKFPNCIGIQFREIYSITAGTTLIRMPAVIKFMSSTF